MSEPVHLFVVTDDAERASLDVVGVHLQDVPPFIRIVTEADEIRKLPVGVRCFGCWFAWGAHRHDAAQLAWQDRRFRGGIEGMTVKFLERLDEWRAKRAEAERRLVAEILAEASDAPVTQYADFINAQAAARAEPSATVAVLQRQSRWS
ncbi:hypothetical protein ACIQUB_06125 [Rhizobium sp. NPDC090275]|uniref:hypothetical protein n=1 Tax=Rhizobium sp. NPDC090275 TaxID=3364498 RepID=UPI003839F5E8